MLVLILGTAVAVKRYQHLAVLKEANRTVTFMGTEVGKGLTEGLGHLEVQVAIRDNHLPLNREQGLIPINLQTKQGKHQTPDNPQLLIKELPITNNQLRDQPIKETLPIIEVAA